MSHVFDTSALVKMARLKHNVGSSHLWLAASNELNTAVREAYVPSLVLVELARRTNIRYLAGRGGPRSLERLEEESFYSDVALGWCNDLTEAGPKLDTGIEAWPLNAQLKLVPLFRDAVYHVAKDVLDESNVRCTDNEGLHLTASLADHLILSVARHVDGVLVSEDRRLCAAAHHLGVPCRTVQNSDVNWKEYWWNCRPNQCGQCLKGLADDAVDHGIPLCRHTDNHHLN